MSTTLLDPASLCRIEFVVFWMDSCLPGYVEFNYLFFFPDLNHRAVRVVPVDDPRAADAVRCPQVLGRGLQSDLGRTSLHKPWQMKYRASGRNVRYVKLDRSDLTDRANERAACRYNDCEAAESSDRPGRRRLVATHRLTESPDPSGERSQGNSRAIWRRRSDRPAHKRAPRPSHQQRDNGCPSLRVSCCAHGQLRKSSFRQDFTSNAQGKDR